MTCDPTDAIPQTCQLNTDVPQVTQLLNLTKIQKAGMKSRKDPVTVQETGIPLYSNAMNVFHIVCIKRLEFLVEKCILRVTES